MILWSNSLAFHQLLEITIQFQVEETKGEWNYINHNISGNKGNHWKPPPKTIHQCDLLMQMRNNLCTIISRNNLCTWTVIYTTYLVQRIWIAKEQFDIKPKQLNETMKKSIYTPWSPKVTIDFQKEMKQRRSPSHRKGKVYHKILILAPEFSKMVLNLLIEAVKQTILRIQLKVNDSQVKNMFYLIVQRFTQPI